MVQTSGTDISGNFTASNKLFLDTINGYAKVISNARLIDSTPLQRRVCKYLAA